MSETKPVRVRFAPSPTGYVHLGSARTALYDYLLARQTKGQFILRIEDTDRKRLVPGAEQELMNGLRALGLKWDEGPDIGGDYGPYRQSERKHIYKEYADKLMGLGFAYPCFCTAERLAEVRQEKQKAKLLPQYDGLCRQLSTTLAQKKIANNESFVIRFKSPKHGQTVVKDLIRGEIVFDNSTLDDFILVKSDGWALYHLAAIVDDYLMKITHVIRGSEWLPTFPLHSLIWRAFNWDEPVWVHLSVFLKPSGKGKMSKREAVDLNKDGYSIFIRDLLDYGYLPQALVNWIALMGWGYDDRSEFFNMQDLIEKFSLDKLNPSPAAINFSKLDHFNKLHIKQLSDDDLCDLLLPYFSEAGIDVDNETLIIILPVIRERMVTLDDCIELCAFLFKDQLDYDPERLKIDGLYDDETLTVTSELRIKLEEIRKWEIHEIENSIGDYMESHDFTPKQLFSYIREVISGQKVSLPLYESMAAMGREKTINRFRQVEQLIGK